MKTMNKIISLCLVALAATACMDFEPKASLADNTTWTTPENFQLYANQFYGWTRDLKSGTDYQNGVSDGVHGDFRGDLFCTTTKNNYSQGDIVVPATDGNYNTLYKRIYYTNLLLKNAEKFGKDKIKTPVGEAYFFRAYLYFELLQIYGDAVVLTEPVDMDSERLYSKRDDRSKVIELIVSDLQNAAAYLPEKEAAAGYLNCYAAWAMLGRAALYEATWQKYHQDGKTGDVNATANTESVANLLKISYEASKEVMDNGGYQLFYNEKLGTMSYRYMFILEDGGQCNPANVNKSANTEYIFAHRHRDGDKQALNVTQGLVGNVYWITSKLADMYLCQDGLPVDKSPLFKGYTGATTEFQNRDNRMAMNMLQHDEKYWNNDGKWRVTWDENDLNNCLVANARGGSGYINKKWGVERQVEDYYEAMDFPVIRYAEVLLNYAEAKYEYGQGTISDEDLNISLNLVRRRSNPNMPALSNSLVSANGLNMREEIRRERTIELLLEGFRVDDIKRWAIAATEMPKTLFGIHFTGTWFETNWTGISFEIDATNGCAILYNSRTWNDRNYLYPLPSDQLQLNPQLGQNPGY